MADAERTVEPSARGIARARRRGEVPTSRELSSAVVFAAFMGVVILGGPLAFGRLIALVRASATPSRNPFDAAAALQGGWQLAVLLLAWPLGLGLVAAAVSGLTQTRGLLTFAAVRLDLARIVPSARRLFRATAAGDLARALAAIALLSLTAWLTMAGWTRGLGALAGAPARTVLAVVAVAARRLGSNLALASLGIGIGDLLWRRYRYRVGLRMTPRDARRERKEAEGDPLHRQERERLRRESLESAAMAEVSRATLVVTGAGTAIALRYDPASSQAPRVVRKGERLVAESMKQVARHARVPIVVDESLATALLGVREGDLIGSTLFEPVARAMAAKTDEKPTAPGPT